jgi:hypothetical protein
MAQITSATQEHQRDSLAFPGSEKLVRLIGAFLGLDVPSMPRRERPLDSDGDVLSQFARDLRGLRKKAGNPTCRELVLFVPNIGVRAGLKHLRAVKSISAPSSGVLRVHCRW